MTINYVGLNYKAYYSAHFHHHANLYVILIYLVFHLHPSNDRLVCKLNWGEKIS